VLEDALLAAEDKFLSDIKDKLQMCVFVKVKSTLQITAVQLAKMCSFYIDFLGKNGYSPQTAMGPTSLVLCTFQTSLRTFHLSVVRTSCTFGFWSLVFVLWLHVVRVARRALV